MSDIKVIYVDGKVRYSVQLSPGLSAEANNLAEILRFVIEYGGTDG